MKNLNGIQVIPRGSTLTPGFSTLKKTTLLFLTVSALFVGCKKETEKEAGSLVEKQEAVTLRRSCGANELLAAHLKADPTFRARRDAIERHTSNYINSRSGASISSITPDGTIIIPIAVHVIYNDAAENISDSQIRSQIDVLNKDFSGTNSDFSLIPTAFKSVAANFKVVFHLQSIDRKSSTKTEWPFNDDMKRTSTGGINPISSSNTLNMWVCDIGGLLGFATYPGGAAAVDGVVIHSRAMGVGGSAAAPYDLGRTASHEVGHWMNLIHMWGDATCGSDLVSDTPQHDAENFGCPSYPTTSTCTSHQTEMTMNYMDYTDDACMYMFTNGQKTRARALFTSTGARSGFAKATGIFETFASGVGRFNKQPTYSGTTVGLATTSTASQFVSGSSQWLRVVLNDNTTLTTPWFVRLLSGDGIAANNVASPKTGTLYFWLKTGATGGTGASVGLWVDDSDGTEQSPFLAISNTTNVWTKYSWNLSGTGWTAVTGNGAITAATVTLDAIIIKRDNGATSWTSYIDDVGN